MIEELTEHKDTRTIQTPMEELFPIGTNPFGSEPFGLFVASPMLAVGLADESRFIADGMAWHDPAMCMVSAAEVRSADKYIEHLGRQHTPVPGDR
ncbi:hypothetical protein FPHYL_11 [Fusarium phyllophilum]|uniref:Uncharacterized protein n=1 Tax=Fusarium phyllophilum TaxID=47803 RepID=A0A8H5KG17_9HYPO|nr:hypothetical protein FPHYL_11 [Fusarium phyllophilum]